MRNREEQLIQTRFRVLDQMGENMKAKVQSYRTNAENYEQSMLKSLRELNSLKKNLLILQSRRNEIKAGISDEEKQLIDTIKHKQENINNDNKVYNQDLKFKKFISNKQPDPTYNVGYDSDFKDEISPISVGTDSIIFTTNSMEFYLSNEFLLKNIDRQDIFEKSIIIGEESILYCSFSKDLKLVFNSAQEHGETEKSLRFTSVRKSDTLFLPVQKTLKAATIHSNRCYDITLSDGNYKMFLKPVKIENLDWFICGLVSDNDYQREKQSIAPWFIIVLSLVLFLIMLSLPFVKLKVMARTEMLGTGTILFAGLAFLLGAAFLVHFLFFQAINNSRINERDIMIKALSEEIKNSLAKEMKLIYQQLYNADRTFLNYPSNKDNLYTTNILNDTTKWKIKKYLYFDYIFWLDKTGTQIALITPFSAKEKLINYSYRDYFKLKDEWYWPGNDTAKYKKFRMESIVSTTSGDHKAAFSMPSVSDNNVIVMTGRFYSLIDPIIPMGYKFCIIDKSGKVWFHSNKYQNQAENLIRECNDDKLLKAALYAEVAEEMNVSYYNHPHRIQIEPLETAVGMPLFLVTMYDLRNEYSHQAQAFISTLLLVIALFLYLVIQVMILIILKRIFRQENVHRNFKLDFINFRNSKIADYKSLIFYFIFALFEFCLVIIPLPGLMAIISIFIIVTILFTSMFIHLHDFKLRSPAVFIVIILNILVLVFLFVQLFREDNDNLNKYILQIVVLSLVLMAFPFMKFNNLFAWSKLKPDVAYSLLILFMVILFGVAPILKFYDITANIENDIHLRHGQLELARQKEDRNMSFLKYYTRIDTIDNNGKNEARDTAHKARKEVGMFTRFWYHTRLSDTVIWATKQSPKNLESFVNAFRPVYNDDFSVASKYLNVDSIKNRPFYWHVHWDSSLVLSYQSPTEDLHKQNLVTRMVRSDKPELNIFNPTWNDNIFNVIAKILLYLLLFGILVLVYKLILFTTRQVFGVSLTRDIASIGFETKVRGQINSGNPILLVNSSAFLELPEVAKKISMEYSTNEFYWLDPKAIQLSDTWLVRDLAKDFEEPEGFSKKIRILMEWMKTSEKLIILVDINPETILNYYTEKAGINKKTDPKAEKKPDVNTEMFSKTLDLFKSFLNRTVILFVPVNYLLPKPETREKNDDETPEVLISRELNTSNYLTGFQEPMNEYLLNIKKEKISDYKTRKQCVTRISEMAEKYYQCLLETSSTEEKFVLLDLAFDMIANIKNRHVIINLLKRGLLIQGKDTIEFMNDSFRVFLLSHYSDLDKQEYKKAMGVGPGNWTGYKIAILLVIVALFVFIFVSNQEFLQNMNRLFITLGASIAGITSLLGLLGRKAKES